VDVRIGVTNAPKEVQIRLADDADRDEVKGRIEKALAGAADVLWLIDRHGAEVGVRADKLAYVELGSQETDSHIGFGA